MVKIINLPTNYISKKQKSSHELDISIATSGRVKVSYENGNVKYEDTKTKEPVLPENLSDFFDEDIKNPKNFLDALDRSIFMRRL